MDMAGLNNLISAADVDAFPTTSRKPEAIHWGTVVDDGTSTSGLAVQLDGEDGTVFPSDSLTYARTGDRVQLRIKDTRATIMGTANNQPLADAISQIETAEERLEQVNNEFTDLINQTQNDLSEAATQWDAARADIQASLIEKAQLDEQRDAALAELQADYVAAQADLAGVLADLDSVQADITNLFQVVNSGENLIHNSYTLEGWSKTSQVSFGEDASGAATFCFPASVTVSQSVFALPNIPMGLVRGKQVTLSVFMRTPATSATMQIFFELVDGETNTSTKLAARTFNMTCGVSGEWVRVTRTFTLTDDFWNIGDTSVITDEHYLRLRFYKTASTSTVEWCCKLAKLELGATATTWTPHASDDADSFAALREEINSTASLLQSTRTEVTNRLNSMGTDVQTALTGGVSVDRLIVTSGARMSDAVIDNLVSDNAFVTKMLTSQIVVEPTEYAPDPGIKPAWWTFFGGANLYTGQTRPTKSSTAFRVLDTADNSGVYGKKVSVAPGTKLAWTCDYFKNRADVIGTFRLYFNQYKKDGTTASTTIKSVTAANAANRAWGTISGVWTVPDDVVAIDVRVGCDSSGDGTSYYYIVANLSVRVQTSGVLIENGAITGEKVNAQSVAGAVGQFIELKASKIVGDTAALNTAFIGQLVSDSAFIDKILSSQIVVEPTEYAPDPAHKPGWWRFSNNAKIGSSAYAAGKAFYLYDDSTSNYVIGKDKAVTAGTKLAWSCNVRKSAASVAGRIRLYLVTYDKDGTSTNRFLFTKTADQVTTAFQQFSGVYTVPDGVVKCHVRVLCDNSGDGTTGVYYVHSLSVKAQTSAVLIENGAITSEKVAASAITANKVAAGAVNATHIQAHSINAADKLTVGATVDGNGTGIYSDGVRTVKSGKGIILHPTLGLVAGSVTGLTSSNVSGKASLWLDLNGNATFKGNVLASSITGGLIDGTTITGGTITGSTITGGTIQTAASGNRITMSSTGLKMIYDSATVFNLNASTGAISLKGSITAGSTITGSTITGSSFQTGSSGQLVLINTSGELRFFNKNKTDGSCSIIAGNSNINDIAGGFTHHGIQIISDYSGGDGYRHGAIALISPVLGVSRTTSTSTTLSRAVNRTCTVMTDIKSNGNGGVEILKGEFQFINGICVATP